MAGMIFSHKLLKNLAKQYKKKMAPILKTAHIQQKQLTKVSGQSPLRAVTNAQAKRVETDKAFTEVVRRLPVKKRVITTGGPGLSPHKTVAVLPTTFVNPETQQAKATLDTAIKRQIVAEAQAKGAIEAAQESAPPQPTKKSLLLPILIGAGALLL